MDKVATTYEKRQVNIISNIVINQFEETPAKDVTTVSIDPTIKEIHNETEVKPGELDSIEKFEERVLFRNLCFKLPSTKSEISLDNKEQKKKIELNDNNCMEDDDITVFNYMTGTYEKVKTNIKEEFSEPKEEPIILEDHIVRDSTPNDATIYDNADTTWVKSLEGFSIINNISSLSNLTLSNRILDRSTIRTNSDSDCSYVSPIFSGKTEPSILECLLKGNLPLPKSSDLYKQNCVLIADSSLNMEENNSKNCSKSNSNDKLPIKLNSLPKELKSSDIPAENRPDSEKISKTALLITNNDTESVPKKSVPPTNKSFFITISSELSGKSKKSKVETYLQEKLRNVRFPLWHYKCESCSHIAKTKEQLISHIYNLHLRDDIVLEFRCPHCRFVCKDKSELEKHESSHKNSLSYKPTRNVTETVDNLVSNRLANTSDTPEESVILVQNISNSDIDSLPTEATLEGLVVSQYRCRLCGYHTKINKYFARHQSSPTRCLPYLNKKVNKLGQNLVKDKEKMKTKSVSSDNIHGLIKCFDCDASFDEKEQLKSHASVSHSASTFICDQHLERIYNCSKCIYDLILRTMQKKDVNNCKGEINMSKTKPDKDTTEGETKFDNESTLIPDKLCQTNKRSHSDKNNLLEGPSVKITKSSGSILHNLLSEKIAMPSNDDAIGNSLEVIAEKKTNNNDNDTSQCNKSTNPNLINDKQEIIRNSNSTEDTQVLIKCFDCNTDFEGKEQLKSHASLIHSASAFKCDLHMHTSKNGKTECSKCIYELLLRTIQNNNIIILKEQINWAQTNEDRNTTEKGEPNIEKDHLIPDKPSKGKKRYCSDENDLVEDSSVMIANSSGLLDLMPDKSKKRRKVGNSSLEDNIIILSDDEMIGSPLDIISKKDSNNHKNSNRIGSQIIDLDADDDTCDPKLHENETRLKTATSKEETVIEQSTTKNKIAEDILNKDNTSEKGATEKYLKENVTKDNILDESVPKKDSDNEDINGHSGSAENKNNGQHDKINLNVDISKTNDYKNTNQESKQISNFQCFDCRNYVTNNLVEFRSHVAKHMGSKFRCMYHWQYKKADCLKCYYQNSLNDIQNCIRMCPTCEFTTADATELENHLQRDNGCQTWSNQKCNPGQLKCFHCRYVTSLKKYLLYHAVDHVHEKFSCNKHKKDDKCLECIYEECLRTAKRDILKCEKCGFKTVIIEVFDIHECKIEISDDKHELSSKKYRCWDCDNYLASTIDELRDHAVLHYKSSFSCDEHNCIVDCSKCIYQALVESLENNIFSCTKCSFKSLSEKDFNLHKNENYCLIGPNVKNCVSTIVHESSSDNDQNNEIKKLDDTTEIDIFQCFHCEYKADKRNLLKHHCKEHYEKTFECDDHLKSTQIDCPKCIYQTVLTSVKNTLFVCDKCHFKTFNGFRLRSHKNQGCEIVAKLFYKCFDCNAAYKLCHPLKNHAIGHIGSKFKCTDHQSFKETCNKCIYQNIIKDIKHNTYTCRKCGYKTYSWNHFKAHESNEANCQVYQAKLIVKGQTLDIEPIKKYVCFDCDFTHERLDFLKKHVVVHRKSQFKCDQHKKKSDEDDCPKCLYAELLFDVPKAKISCHDCNSRPRFSQMLGLHQHVAARHLESFYACPHHLSKKDEFCGKCLYQGVVKNMMGDNYINLICWDCKEKTFCNIATFKKHIEEFHLASKFKCVDHSENQKRCNKCLYERELRNCAAAKSKRQVMALFKCFDCGFSNEKLHIWKQHVLGVHRKSKFKCLTHSGRAKPNWQNCPECFYYVILSNPNMILRCYECKSNSQYSSIPALRNHLLKNHKECSFVCSQHTSKSVNCIKCWFQLLSKVRQEIFFQCFDCNYKSDCMELFKEHVHSLHGESTFVCKEHFGDYFDDCPTCFYSAIVSHKSSSKGETANNAKALTIIRCYECPDAQPFWQNERLRHHILKKHRTCSFVCPRHTNKSINCGRCWFQRYTQKVLEDSTVSLCCECGYELKCLNSHIKKSHMDSTFKCNEHLVEALDGCQKCSYTELVKYIRNMRCYFCNESFNEVKTLKSHVYHHHKNSKFVCPIHSSMNDSCGKCFFQTILREAFKFTCCDCNKDALPDKDSLKTHIKEFHLRSKFTCPLHLLSSEPDSCNKCSYEELVHICLNDCATESNLASTSNDVIVVFECFDCNYSAYTVSLMKNHIRKSHLDSMFTCSKHNLGEISSTCTECTYENLVLLSNEG